MLAIHHEHAPLYHSRTSSTSGTCFDACRHGLWSSYTYTMCAFFRCSYTTCSSPDNSSNPPSSYTDLRNLRTWILCLHLPQLRNPSRQLSQSPPPQYTSHLQGVPKRKLYKELLITYRISIIILHFAYHLKEEHIKIVWANFYCRAKSQSLFRVQRANILVSAKIYLSGPSLIFTVPLWWRRVPAQSFAH